MKLKSICFFSLVDNFSVFLHISTKNSFKRTKKSLESASVNPNKSTRSQSLYTCLPDGIFHQSNFSKVLSCTIIKNFVNRPVILSLFSDELSLSDNIELITSIALTYNIFVSSKVLLFQSITNLISFIRIHLS